MSRRRFSPEEQLALWRAWKSGSTLLQIAQELNRRSVSVLNVLRRERYKLKNVKRFPGVCAPGDRSVRLPGALAGRLRR